MEKKFEIDDAITLTPILFVLVYETVDTVRAAYCIYALMASLTQSKPNSSFAV